tara:strand:+ start:79 stop:345 length:267 start_codon:yes stop_codon:yes gene_type:complete
MPVVFLTPTFQKLGETPEKIEVDGTSIKSVIDNVNKLHPGFKDLLIENNRIKPGISIVVNGEIKRTGLLGSVSKNSEIHFLSAISGGH